ncbi:Trypsin [Popillia japonica]|uniref:Trypsin n=1 Tax=Popillia japonica TaxID=7064 RepID=A0AAW1NKN7_POPJA
MDKLCFFNKLAVAALFLSCLIVLPVGQPSNSLYESIKFKLQTSNSHVLDYFKCLSGETIPRLWKCDNEADCRDASDETKELCSYKKCPSDSFRCAYGACISRFKICDGYNDCIDSSDEDLQMCSFNGSQNLNSVVQYQTEKCGFKCGSGECISVNKICDGRADCKDGTDEVNRKCELIHCPSFLFRCKYGACIPRKYICDGKEDCLDASDEDYDMCLLNEEKNSSLLIRKRRQDCEFRCNSGDCIEMEHVCDGSVECPDGSDETSQQCQGVRCPSFLFKCKYGACIRKNQVCNGERNCADGSDEQANCPNTLSSGTCKNSEFHCKDGTCIDNLLTCDGIKNCPDGSDETVDSYGSDETVDSCIGVICPAFLFRCAYGACVHKSAKCNGKTECIDGSDEVGCGTTAPVTPTPTPPPVTPPVVQPDNGCLLPPHPLNGKYMIQSGSTYQVNRVVSDSTIITMNCNQGYILSDTNFFFCNKVTWEPPLNKGYCVRTCPALQPTDTYDVSCSYRNGPGNCSACPALQPTDTYDVSCSYRNGPGNCSAPIQGTIADIKCKAFYVRQDWVIPSCQDGHWDPTPQPCNPECGQKIVNVQTLVIGGTNAQPGEYPWVLAIYRSSSKQHICGASMISRLYVLSAAHCFYDENGALLDKNEFILAAGKYYRDLDKPEKGVQIRKIKELRIHEDYKGAITKYRDDIAVIEVDRLDVTRQVQPVCIDWSNAYEDQDFVEDKKAVVPGWGYTSEGGQPAEVLKKLIVPYRSKDVCEQFMEPDFFNQYYSSDKICAGYKDKGTSVCSGDSGGGLFFRSQPTTFYVRAVVSLAPRSQVGCDSNHYALYTKVSKYLNWLQTITRRRV